MNFNRQERFAFFGTLIFGLLAHAHMLTNNYQYHDDVGFYGFGAGFQLGRSSNVILDNFFRFFFGGDIVSLSMFNGILALLFLAMTAVFVVRILKLKNHIFAALTGGIMAVFPSVTSVFGYRFMAYTWAFTFLLSAFGVYLITYAKFYAPARYSICIICQVFAIGIYQAVIPFTLSLAALYLFRKFIEEDCSWKNFFGEILRWSGISAAFMALYGLYVMIPFWICKLMGEEFSFTSYQGFENAGSFSLFRIVYNTLRAYKRFFLPYRNSISDMYPMSLRFFFYVVLIISVMLTVNIIMRMYSHSIRKARQCIIISLALPFAIDFIYVMSASKGTFIYSNMQYSQIFVFIYLMFIIEISLQHNFVSQDTVKKHLCRTAFILLGIICFLYIRFDNICYLKADYMQKRAVSYFTVLQSRIQSIPGYKDDYPVVFVNEFDKMEQTVTHTEQFDSIHIFPYQINLLNNYNWVNFMKMHVGYSPEVYHAGKNIKPDKPGFLELDPQTEEQVNQMNRYPDDGSIKIIDRKIFVNF